MTISTTAAQLVHWAVRSENDPQIVAAWRWLAAASEAYPRSPEIRPLKPRTATEKARELGTADLVTSDTGPHAWPLPRALKLTALGRSIYLTLTGEPVDCDLLEKHLLTHGLRSALVVWPRGARHALHVICHYYAGELVRRGYTVTPIASGTAIKALKISRGRHNYWWVDCEAISGDDAQTLPAIRETQSGILGVFGASLRPTIASTAIQCLQHTLRDDAWLWRPAPLLVAMCRNGAAFRGGYVYADRYRGPIWKIDRNRSYTSALLARLPVRMGFAAPTPKLSSMPSIRLCTIYGPGALPLYIGVWSGSNDGFIKAHWNGQRCIAVLPSQEIDGIKKLGYHVVPGFGFCAYRTTQYTDFVAGLETLRAQNGEDTALYRISKLLGNSVYGKLAQSPRRLEVMYSERLPGKDWLAFITETGEEIDNLWVAETTRYQAHQHIDVGASVAATARGELYRAAAACLAAGQRIVAADTDMLCTDGPPPPTLDLDTRRLGAWRLEYTDSDGLIGGTKAYSIGGTHKVSGVATASRELVEVLQRGDTVTVGQKVMRLPWREPHTHGSERLIRLGRSRG